MTRFEYAVRTEREPCAARVNAKDLLLIGLASSDDFAEAIRQHSDFCRWMARHL